MNLFSKFSVESKVALWEPGAVHRLKIEDCFSVDRQIGTQHGFESASVL